MHACWWLIMASAVNSGFADSRGCAFGLRGDEPIRTINGSVKAPRQETDVRGLQVTAQLVDSAGNDLCLRRTTVTDAEGRFKLSVPGVFQYRVGVNLNVPPEPGQAVPRTFFPDAHDRRGARLIDVSRSDANDASIAIAEPRRVRSFDIRTVDSNQKPLRFIRVLKWVDEMRLDYPPFLTDSGGRIAFDGLEGLDYEFVAEFVGEDGALSDQELRLSVLERHLPMSC